MNNIRTFYLPKIIDDTRLDLMIEIFNHISFGKDLVLSFKKTVAIAPAGYAILAIMADAICEQKASVKYCNLKKDFIIPSEVLALENKSKADLSFINLKNLEINKSGIYLYGKSSSIAPEFIEKLNLKFNKLLDENTLWHVTLTFNELMQNAVDHSTSERYFLYAGLSENNFKFGVLDSGVSIPAKMETRYNFLNDEVFLKEALKKGIGTRRDRIGGMGLYFLQENIKDAHGKLTIISRNAQLRLNYGARKFRSSPLKQRLKGTWCMASIPLRKDGK